MRAVQTQQQKLILAPRMIQSMEILQLPLMALQERIEQELQENAVLELEESDPDLPEEPVEQENPDSPTVEEKELVVDDKSNSEDDFERLLEIADQWGDDYFEERRPLSSNRMEEESDRKHDAIANMVDRPATLQDYLREQLRYFNLDEPTRQMADRIIYALDDNGWLPVPLDDLIDATAGPEQLEAAKAALAIVQRLDPPGVAARDLRECLLLQLTPDMPFYEEMQTIISDHLEDVSNNKLPHIAEAHRLLAGDHPRGDGRDSQVEPQAWLGLSGGACGQRDRPTCLSIARRTARIACEPRTATCRGSSSAPTTARCCGARTRRARRASTSSGRSTRPNG